MFNLKLYKWINPARECENKFNMRATRNSNVKHFTSMYAVFFAAVHHSQPHPTVAIHLCAVSWGFRMVSVLFFLPLLLRSFVRSFIALLFNAFLFQRCTLHSCRFCVFAISRARAAHLHSVGESKLH